MEVTLWCYVADWHTPPIHYITGYRAFYCQVMNPQDKAKELSNYFCSPSDVFHPNVASIRNAIKCCEQMIKEHDDEILESNDVNRINYWHDVIDALNAL